VDAGRIPTLHLRNQPPGSGHVQQGPVWLTSLSPDRDNSGPADSDHRDHRRQCEWLLRRQGGRDNHENLRRLLRYTRTDSSHGRRLGDSRNDQPHPAYLVRGPVSNIIPDRGIQGISHIHHRRRPNLRPSNEPINAVQERILGYLLYLLLRFLYHNLSVRF